MSSAESIGIIGGTGFDSADFIDDAVEHTLSNRYGDVDLIEGVVGATRVAVINRHGGSHQLPPHKINYRANILALKERGVGAVIASNAVGGIAANIPPESIVLPDQIIDYTYGRAHTFFDDFSEGMSHIDFSEPFDSDLRIELGKVFHELGHKVLTQGCYGCTQGPRLETKAEIARMKRDGCTLVGMTGMPEAALARELDLPYASVCMVVNWAAGLADEISLAEIRRNADVCMRQVQSAVQLFLQRRA